jgi:phage tail-like protein
MNENKKCTYLEYLPEIYRESDFINRYLKIFERILSGIDDDDDAPLDYLGIEQLLDQISDYFDPDSTPEEFLGWLAGWVALELPENWREDVKRKLIQRIVQLYKKRGTKQGLEEFLEIYYGPGVSIDEWYLPFQLGVSSFVGKENALDGGPPGFFSVKVIIPEPDLQLKAGTEKAIRAIIDREKPAHTYYRLKVVMPTMKVGVLCTVGKDTIVG